MRTALRFQHVCVSVCVITIPKQRRKKRDFLKLGTLIMHLGFLDFFVLV